MPDLNYKIRQLMTQESDNINGLNVLYKQTYNWINHYWNNLHEINNDVLIVCNNSEEAILIFKEIRAYGDSYIIENLIFIKNIKDNYKTLFRKNILAAVENSNIDSIFQYSPINSIENLEIINDSLEGNIIQSFMTNKQYIYVGDNLETSQYQKLIALLRFKFQIIECVKGDKVVGMCVTKAFMEKAFIYKSCPTESLRTFFEFNKIYLKIPVY